MADNPISRDKPGSVGYRRPPVGVRFQKGQSGNPAGKRKGSKNRPRPARSERLRSLLLEEAYRPVTVNENGKEVVMPMAQAVFRSLAAAAVKGEARAQAMFFKTVSATETGEAAIEELLAAAREEAEDGSPELEIMIVDPADGRKTPYRPDDGPQLTTGKSK